MPEHKAFLFVTGNLGEKGTKIYGDPSTLQLIKGKFRTPSDGNYGINCSDKTLMIILLSP